MMMGASEIRKVSIRDIALINANSIKSNSALSQIEYIDISSVGTGEFTEPPKLIPFADAPSRARRIVKAGDTILSTVRPNRRSFLFLASPSPIAVASTGFAVLTPTRDVDARYLYYWVTRQDFTDYLSLHAKGAAYPAVSAEDIGGAEIDLPPLPTQHRIAGILSTYDELIENNQWRIRILEDMARSLYREWFVHFRYPGHESVPLVASPLGQIPQGWEVRKLCDVLELNYGKALKKEDRRDGEYPVFGSSGVVGTHDTALVEGPGIIVGRKGNVGSVFWCDDNFFVIDTAYFVTSSLPLRFLFYVLPTLNFINSDAAVPGLSRNQAYTLELLVPPADLLAKFCELADTFEHHATTLQRKTANLRRTRDLLLPRLLSGQIALAA